MAEYHLAPKARRDLQDIWLYTHQQWGIAQAGNYLDALTTAFAELVDAPKSAPACDHIRSGYRRLRVERHVVYFRITAYGIHVVRVLHERMDTSRHL